MYMYARNMILDIHILRYQGKKMHVYRKISIDFKVNPHFHVNIRD